MAKQVRAPNFMLSQVEAIMNFYHSNVDVFEAPISRNNPQDRKKRLLQQMTDAVNALDPEYHRTEEQILKKLKCMKSEMKVKDRKEALAQGIAGGELRPLSQLSLQPAESLSGESFAEVTSLTIADDIDDNRELLGSEVISPHSDQHGKGTSDPIACAHPSSLQHPVPGALKIVQSVEKQPSAPRAVKRPAAGVNNDAELQRLHKRALLLWIRNLKLEHKILLSQCPRFDWNRDDDATAAD